MIINNSTKGADSAKAIAIIVTSMLTIVMLLIFIQTLINKYSDVDRIWSSYTNNALTIVAELQVIERNLGYGGLIHNFKNYLLRGKKSYYAACKNNIVAVEAGLKNLNVWLKDKNSLADIKDISSVTLSYKKNLRKVKLLHEKKIDVSRIDKTVAVNDLDAFKALNRLRDNIKKTHVTAKNNAKLALEKANHLLLAARWGVIPITLVVIIFLYYIRYINFSKREIIKANHWIDTLFDTAPQALICSDTHGNIVRVNAMSTTLLGYSAEEFLKLNISHLLPDYIRKSHKKMMMNYFSAPSVKEMARNRKVTIKHKNGRLISIKINLNIAVSEKDIVTISSITDITMNNLMSEKLKYQASHDGLTGLINRAYFESKLKKLFSTENKDSVEHVLFFMDLDQFKIVNDTVGHIAGDELLRQIGQLIQKHTRGSDILARIGGDEFALLAHNCEIEEAKEKAKKIISLLRNFKFYWNNKIFSVGVSIGLAPINSDSMSVTDVLKCADIACFSAKKKGRNTFDVYEPRALNNESSTMLSWAPKIAEAMEYDFFSLFTQVIKPINKKNTSCFYEVLLRLQTKNDEFILPRDFLPAAERYNLCSKIDLWVIEKVFKWIKHNKRNLKANTFFTINLSGSSVGNDFILESIILLLKENIDDPSIIMFEITETAAMFSLKNSRHFVESLKSLGCQFALDDFGSGLASFSYLKNIPVDFVKIDGQFIRHIDTDEVDKETVRSINSIAHKMGLKTVAEYVENQNILNILEEIGVDYVQGFYIGYPKNINELPTISS